METNFKLFIEEDYKSMGKKAAELLSNYINANKKAVVGFATGSTPISMYDALTRMNEAGEVDFSEITAFNLDEYHPIKKSNTQSYYYFMQKYLFDYINVDQSRLNIPNGESSDYESECKSYEEKIAAAGGIDIQILGIGMNGHIGFNEPSDIFEKNTHYVTLDQSTIEANSKNFERIEDVPKNALSMGIGTIMRAKKILLLANGNSKAKIVKQALFGDITPHVPASVLQLHKDVTVILDSSAAAYIS